MHEKNTLWLPFGSFSLILHDLACFDRKIDEKDVIYTHTPGHVAGFGALVNRIGRGFPKSIACGREFTQVKSIVTIVEDMFALSKDPELRSLISTSFMFTFPYVFRTFLTFFNI